MKRQQSKENDSKVMDELRELIAGLSPEKLLEMLFFVKYMGQMTKEQISELAEMMRQEDFKVRQYIQSLMEKENAKGEVLAV